MRTLDAGTAKEADGEAAALSRMLLGPVAGRLAGRRLAVVADGALQYLPFGSAAGACRDGPADRRPRDRLPPLGLRAGHPAARSRRAGSGPWAPGRARGPGVRRGRPPGRAGRPAGGGFSPEGARARELSPSFRAPFDPPGSGADRIAGARRTRRCWRWTSRPAATPVVARRACALPHRPLRHPWPHRRPHARALGPGALPGGGGRQAAGRFPEPAPTSTTCELGADLVVLSGCETALGREIRGEGLVGLTQGFLYAGAARVVASLWRVQDRATAELMGRFYRGHAAGRQATGGGPARGAARHPQGAPLARSLLLGRLRPPGRLAMR